jgi:thiol:disulfide interchange protein DsbD
MRAYRNFLAAVLFAASFLFGVVPTSADIPQTSDKLPTSSNARIEILEESAIKTRLLLPSTELEPGKSYPVLLEITVVEDYHINSDKPLDKVPVPTVALFSSTNPNVTFGRVVYPKAKIKELKFADLKLSVWDGTIYIATSISLSTETKEPVVIKAHLDYQACTDYTCLMPTDKTVESSVKVGTGGKPLEEEIFAKHAPQGEGGVFDRLRGGGGATAFLLIFIGGLALNLTPCIYPMIPVTVGYFGAVSGKVRSRRQRVEHALVYLMGMALMYSSLGMVAALTGSLFGALMQNTIVVLIMVALMLTLSASMFGAFEIIVPSSLMDFSSKSYAGFFGSFFMGLTVGILAAPCVGPFVIGMLTFVGEKQDPVLGFFLFFTLALGLGLPLTILAIFSGAISSLPRSGVWMEWVRKVFGVIMVGMAAYFARPLLGGEAVFMRVEFVISFVGGAYLMYAGRGVGGKVFRVFGFGIGLGFIALSIWLATATAVPGSELPFKEFSKEALRKTVAAKRPAVVDFTADWCVPCRELKLFTFGDPRVLIRKRGFDAFVVDLTNVDDKKLAYKKEYGVFGVPTVLLIAPDGHEVDRFTGFISADEFLKKLDKLK